MRKKLLVICSCLLSFTSFSQDKLSFKDYSEFVLEHNNDLIFCTHSLETNIGTGDTTQYVAISFKSETSQTDKGIVLYENDLTGFVSDFIDAFALIGSDTTKGYSNKLKFGYSIYIMKDYKDGLFLGKPILEPTDGPEWVLLSRHEAAQLLLWLKSIDFK